MKKILMLVADHMIRLIPISFKKKQKPLNTFKKPTYEIYQSIAFMW